MRFSIIIPVYNVELYLRKCLDSVLTQSCQDYELILIDDGSTDLSGAICEEYEEKREMIYVIHQENQGLSSARNAGIKKAKGQWLVFLDSDDWIEPDMLRILERNICTTDADMYCFNAEKVDEEGKPVEKLLFSVENETKIFSCDERRFDFYLRDLMQYKVGWETCFRIYKRSIVEKHNVLFLPTDRVFAEDYLFTFQYLLYAEKLCLLCDIFYHYRQRKGSLIHSTEKRTVLPRLYRWAEEGYKSVRQAHMPVFRKRYYELYFMLINYHMQYMLADLEETELESAWRRLEKSWLHRKWIGQIQKHRNQLERNMRIKKWL